jgi:GT2 family glycosyltransferase
MQMMQKVAVVIASCGRPATLEVALQRLAEQTRRPDYIVLSVVSDDDLPDILPKDLPVEVITGPKGTTAQRNRALNRLYGHVEILVFFDDDYVPSRKAIGDIAEAFLMFPHVAGISGRLLADGARGSGIDAAAAATLVDRADAERGHRDAPAFVPGVAGIYGCNMAFRAAAIDALRFDEKLPLYGWLEDADFAARVPGVVGRTDAFSGVHCGVKSGRDTKSRRYGYSQVSNPAYLWRKGSLPAGRALGLVMRALAANTAKALRPEAWIDRRGRLAGNIIALGDVLRGRLTPWRIRDL